jgi:glycosyltransferase involved in cell wall biosynthesis
MAMATLPKISVVTPTFNSETTLRDTIESVLRQAYPNYEHLVIDGGSKDGTLEILQQYPHIQWISEKDEGHYHAMNKGIKKASGEIINILNADDCYRDGALLSVGTAFQNNPSWEALFGDIVYVNASGDEIYRREEALFDYDVLRFSGVCYVIHQTLFVRKELHDRLGLYRYKDFVNGCDFDFILAMGRAGCRVGHVPRLLINYRYHPHGQSADLRVTRNMARERARLMREHGAPGGLRGRIVSKLYRVRRQWQKLCHRGKIDLIPGTWILQRHMQPQTQFTSNIDMKKLEGSK